MRKKLAALVLAVLCLTAAAGAAAGKRDAETPSLYDRGLEVVQVLSEMAGSEEYVDAFASDSDIKSILQDIGGGYSAPKAVYALSVADAEMEQLVALIGLELDDVSDELKAFLMQRMLGSLTTRANSLDGAQTLAAASICTYAKTFVDESAEGDVVYLYTYDGAAPVAVTFTIGEDHTVTASGVFVLCDDFASGSAEEIADFFDYITVDVAEVQPEE